MSTVSQPDAARGVFETLLVLRGEPVELDAHLERLAWSLDSLYAAVPPEGIAELARERAAGLGLGRLRLTVRPRGSGLACDAASDEVDPSLHFPDAEHAAELISLPLPGGLGVHKWADRSRLPDRPPPAVPLVFDRDGAVLEANRANVFVAHEGVLSTPPLDGRILPGVTRAAAIELANDAGIEVLERNFGMQELLAADEVLLTGSVRGIEPARSLDGAALSPRNAVTTLLGTALRQRWTHSSKPAAPSGRPVGY
jgi:para-aminobenzoate synthetase/4-amino-4-deoxychorismate lyase